MTLNRWWERIAKGVSHKKNARIERACARSRGGCMVPDMAESAQDLFTGESGETFPSVNATQGLAGGTPPPIPDWNPETVLAWIDHLHVTQGEGAGEPFQIAEFQERWIRGSFAAGIHESALSIARGNGKTTLLGAIAAGTINGPLAQPRAQTIIVAASHGQARLVFDHALAFRPDIVINRARYAVRSSTMECAVTDRHHGTELRVVSSDARRAHGLAPSLVICDEPAQWPAGNAAMVSALRTALGKIPNSRLVAIGTRAASQLHWFNEMLDKPAPGRYRQCHMADDLDSVLDEKQWRLANPMFDAMPRLAAAIKREAKMADINPSDRAAFVALRLNGGVPDTDEVERLIDPEQWARCLSVDAPERDGSPVWGIDLGGNVAMSAVASAWNNGRLETLAMFGNDPALEQRDARDSAGGAYLTARSSGELLVSPVRVPKPADLLEEARARFGMPSGIVCDRYRIAELGDALDSLGWHVPVLTRGQGYKEGSEDVRGWRRAVASHRLHPVKPAVLLTLALSEAVVAMDSSGNRKLAKGGEGGRRRAVRDDVAAAAILAVAHRNNEAAQAPAVYRGAV